MWRVEVKRLTCADPHQALLLCEPIFAVGDGVVTKIKLHFHCLLYRLVLHRYQIALCDFSSIMGVTLLQQVRRSQQ